MKHWLMISAFAMVQVLVSSTEAAESDRITRLDEALKAVATFQYGQDSGPLVFVEQIVVEAAKDPKQRRAVEQHLLRALESASTQDAKSFLCRQLRTIGTKGSVPYLEKLLTEPDLSHMARYALGSIEEPEAAAALHRALSKTSGKLQVGIINTLANRRYRQALPHIAKLLRSPDSDVAQAAARALGRIGGTDAARALITVRPRATKALRQRIDSALLLCAERFLAQGQTAEATGIYRLFYSPGQAKHVRLAGLRGLAAAQGAKAVSLLTDAIKSPDPDIRAGAIGFMTIVKGRDATRVFAALLPSLPPDTQQLMLHALAARGDTAVAPAVANATRSPHPAVRIAALEALGSVGDASAVPVLARAAAMAEGREKQVARAGLVHLSGDGVDEELIHSIVSGDAKVRVEVIHALAGRRVSRALSGLLQAARDNDETVRHEAIRALGILAGKSELDTLVKLLVNPKDAKDRSVIERAIVATFKRINDKDSQAGPLLAALAAAPIDAKPTLLRLLGRPATAEALAAVCSALEEPSAEVRDAAIRTLADWPNAAPAEVLLTLVRNNPGRTSKVLALRGYVRMAGMSDNPTAMYARAMELAERPDDKKLVLGGLGSAGSAQALSLVERYLRDQHLQAEAALAAIQIANRLRQKDATWAKVALRNVIKVVKDPRISQQAQDIINEMEQYEGYILLWLAAGPYSQKGKDSRQIFDTAFPPEKPSTENVKWERLTQGVGSWDINLEATFGARDHCAAYLRTDIWSPKEQQARLEMGSDDAIKAWLNGKLIHANYTNRGLSPRQDLVKVDLQKGWNELLLKVVDHEGGWSFCCRVRKPDGSAPEGLKVQAK